MPDPQATPQRDRAILNGALTLENTAVFAYGVGIPLLRGDIKGYAEQFLEQEHEHARALAGLVREMDGEPNRPKPSEEYRAAFPLPPDRRPSCALPPTWRTWPSPPTRTVSPSSATAGCAS